MGVFQLPLDRRLEAELRALEIKADSAKVPGSDAPFFNVAGDLCLTAKDEMRALDYYGKTIDAYLKAERWESAAAMCRKVLRQQPGAVRARCTLSWLAIGKGFDADAQEQVMDYAGAAYRAGREILAAGQLRRMGEVAVSETIRLTLAEQLLVLGADRAADHLFGAVYRDTNFGRKSASEVSWALIRRAALMGPKDLDSIDSLSMKHSN